MGAYILLNYLWLIGKNIFWKYNTVCTQKAHVFFKIVKYFDFGEYFLKWLTYNYFFLYQDNVGCSEIDGCHQSCETCLIGTERDGQPDLCITCRLGYTLDVTQDDCTG